MQNSRKKLKKKFRNRENYKDHNRKQTPQKKNTN